MIKYLSKVKSSDAVQEGDIKTLERFMIVSNDFV